MRTDDLVITARGPSGSGKTYNVIGGSDDPQSVERTVAARISRRHLAGNEKASDVKLYAVQFYETKAYLVPEASHVFGGPMRFEYLFLAQVLMCLAFPAPSSSIAVFSKLQRDGAPV
jgi:hypothetical protein